MEKAKKDVPWTHTFVCLPERDMDSVPGDYTLMTANGLCKAKLHLSEISTAMEIHLAILAQFPKIADCGGYELLHTYDNTNKFNVTIPPPEAIPDNFFKKFLVKPTATYARFKGILDLKSAQLHLIV